MATWQLFVDDRNGCRWERSPNQLTIDTRCNPIEQPISFPRRLPSTSDLLLQGISMSADNKKCQIDTPPSFLQGQSSERDNENSYTNLFQTGSGKAVTISSSGLVRAKQVLGSGENDEAVTFTGFVSTKKQGRSSQSFHPNSLSNLRGGRANVGFEDAISVPMSPSRDNSDILGVESNTFPAKMATCQLFVDERNGGRWERSPNQLTIDTQCNPISFPRRLPSTSNLFLQGISMSAENKKCQIDTLPSFIQGQSSERDNGNSLFQTGSGKAVTISSSGLVRAKQVFGSGANDEAVNFTGFVPTKKQGRSSQSFHPNSLSNLRGGRANVGLEDAISVPKSPSRDNSDLSGVESNKVTVEGAHSFPTSTAIRFHTASGRSISISGNSLKRVRGLLEDPELGNYNGGDSGEPGFPVTTGIRPDHNFLKYEAVSKAFSCDAVKAKQAKKFISPVRTSYEKQWSDRLEKFGTGSNLIKKFDAEEHERTIKPYNDMPSVQKPVRRDSLENSPRHYSGRRSSDGPLVDISNTIGMVRYDQQSTVEKGKLASRISVSPFKRPRNFKFVPPMNRNSSVFNGLPSVQPQDSYCPKKISTTRYHRTPRKYVREYLGVPPYSQNMLASLPSCIRRMNPENAGKHVFHNQLGSSSIGVDTLSDMLLQSGSSMQYISKEWVANHYKWIVWKLACYERFYPARFSGKLLTVFNVLEELKYRYDREVNHSHRSALRKILEGDAPPSSVMVLCISSIHRKCGSETEALPSSSGSAKSKATQIELTDGWYSVNAILDEFLSVKLASEKLFVGQKLRICGAGLCGWTGPTSPLEASKTINLCLHINGTYRAHWADRLGFCKGSIVPLAFRCIRGGGGAVPCTLVGVKRIYPLLYRERLHNGGYAVRSERTETKIMQLYDQRRLNVAEGTMSESRREVKSFQCHNKQSIDEGEELYRILETAAEPDIIMADMSLEQLASFASYQSRQEALMQSDMQQTIEKALKDSGLGGRDVIPFMRVRVVGLTSRNSNHCYPGEGLITIWNPTEKQQSELVEGHTYAITGLVPLTSDLNTLYLQARGPSTKWRPLSPSTTSYFQPFFNPRRPILLSTLGEIPVQSEFDIAALVIHVGEVVKIGHRKMQWVFVADGSNHELGPEETSSGLLAISFYSPSIDCDSITPINYYLTGSTVGFCNLMKKEKDTANNMWLAEATDNSTYFLSYDNKICGHLKDVAVASDKWARASYSTIAKLKKKVFSIIHVSGRQ